MTKLSSTSSEISELWSGQSLPLLKALHIVTRDGKINQDTRRKLKQVYHLVQFLRDLVPAEDFTDPRIVDVGSGKSYLGFILYDLWFARENNGHVWSIESREELVRTCEKLAEDSGFQRMLFSASTIRDATAPNQDWAQVDCVTALHACDTATDEAILLALKLNAKRIALVPCCQAELASQLKKNSDRTAWTELFRAPIHAREFGSHLTNVLRVLFLRAHGYEVTVTELIGWEHSMKNELILAKFTGKKDEKSKNEFCELLELMKVHPKLLNLQE